MNHSLFILDTMYENQQTTRYLHPIRMTREKPFAIHDMNGERKTIRYLNPKK